MDRATFKQIDLGPCVVSMTGGEIDPYFANLQAYVSDHPGLADYARQALKPDSICLDIGANIGVTTLLMCHLCPDGHIYSFEPSPINAAHLRKNLEINGVKNCTVIEAGLGDKADTLNFHVSEFGAGSHFVTDAHLDRDRRNTIPVPVITLDDFMKGANAPKGIDFIKMDAEGFEPAIIAGGARTLDRFCPPIFMEFNSWSLYFAHRFDPYTFASALWYAFYVDQVRPDGSLSPAADGDVKGFLFYNMTSHGCVDDVVLTKRAGATIPTLAEMTDSAYHLRMEIMALRQSTSWKVTAPLRALKSLFA